MACRIIAAGPGFTAVLCGPRGRAASCSTPGCTKPVTRECDYPVVRKGAAGTCDRKLCDSCRRPGAKDDEDWCGAHSNLVARKAAAK